MRLNNYSGLYLLGIILWLAGCAGPRLLMPTPNVYLDGDLEEYRDLAAPLKSTEVQIFYITDRTSQQDENGNIRYDEGRSASLAFGTTVVNLGAESSWEDLLEASRSQERSNPMKLELVTVNELVRSPPLPLPYTLRDGQIVEEPTQVAQLEKAAEAFRQIMVRQLELTDRKEVFIYIHGYNNTFDDAAFALAELWHFLGRRGVPLIYTWPAGYPGLFGYTYDRESSEFTVYHLREILKRIAGFDEVEKIHLIAHSRGTDIAMSVLRDLTLIARGADLDPREQFKIHNFVLAAPDLDLQVAEQRLTGDKLESSVNRFTIYTSPADEAIGISSKLFASPRGRVGTFGFEKMSDTIKAHLQKDKTNFAIVNFPGASDSQFDRYGHSYFRNAPEVSADLVLMLRDDLDPGTAGRPLEPLDNMFWLIPPGYPSNVPVE